MSPAGTSTSAPMWQTRERVLERLLEGQEFQDAFRHRRVETDTAFVGADGVVVLDPPAALHADIALVVLPADPKADHAIRLGDAAQDLVAVIVFLVLDEVEDVLGHFLHGLSEFGLARIPTPDSFDERRQINVIRNRHGVSSTAGETLHRLSLSENLTLKTGGG
jgi:hypothetical protein